MNGLLSDLFCAFLSLSCVFLVLFLFVGPLPRPQEGKDAFVAHINGKFRETP